jgi:predicted PurR-regulated permease PerM
VIGRWLGAVAGALVAAYLIWGLRSLIVPIAVGSLLAYVCYPLVARLERYRLTRGLAIVLLMLAFLSVGVVLAIGIRAGVSSEIGTLDFKTRALFKLNQRYEQLMGLDATSKGNRLYQFVHDDLDPIVDRMNSLLALTPEERSRFLASHSGRADADSDALLEYDRANLQTLERRGLQAAARSNARGQAPQTPGEAGRGQKTPLAALAAILSTWIVAPVVFLFLLRDTGEIKRGFLRLIPNRLFEPTLAVLNDLDRALGGYVRGLFLECCFLGLTVAVVFAVVGIPLRWAIPLGLVAGATNVIPYLGSAIALLTGLAFPLLTDQIHPLLPMIHADNVAVWVVIGVLLAEVLKNVVFEPFVLGGAVRLHPLVVVIGVLGGGILFGLAGLLLAIPTMTIVKAFAASASAQLKAYGLV